MKVLGTMDKELWTAGYGYNMTWTTWKILRYWNMATLCVYGCVYV